MYAIRCKFILINKRFETQITEEEAEADKPRKGQKAAAKPKKAALKFSKKIDSDESSGSDPDSESEDDFKPIKSTPYSFDSVTLVETVAKPPAKPVLTEISSKPAMKAPQTKKPAVAKPAAQNSITSYMKPATSTVATNREDDDEIGLSLSEMIARKKAEKRKEQQLPTASTHFRQYSAILICTFRRAQSDEKDQATKGKDHGYRQFE
jgi:hypothetical protein